MLKKLREGRSDYQGWLVALGLPLFRKGGVLLWLSEIGELFILTPWGPDDIEACVF